MFTGIVRDIGRVEEREARAGDVRLTVAVGRLDLSRLQLGDSICVQGVCLTVAARLDHGFCADVSPETLSRTTLGTLDRGARVNLEPALRAGDPLGGHMVCGHVDGIGKVVGVDEDARSLRIGIAAPPELTRYIAPKGSITVDGASLTVNEVEATRFGVNLIPHTRGVTTLGALVVGADVNLEIDTVARYLERLLNSAMPR